MKRYMKRGHFWLLYFLLLGLLITALVVTVKGAAVIMPESDIILQDSIEKPEETGKIMLISPYELPRPTIGEVDAEAEENYWIEQALLARSHKIEGCKITYYCCERYPHICGTGDGITALGNEVLPGVSCAVPKSIPLGATVMIDWGDGELEYRRADDRGGGVVGDHIDLAVPTHREALELGVGRLDLL